MRGATRGSDYLTAMRSLFGNTTFLVRERDEGAENHQLFEYNLLDPDYREATVRMDGVDILDTIRLPFTGQIVGFSYFTHRRQHEFFAEPLQFAQAEIDHRFPNGENIFVDGSETHRYYVFKTTEPSDPGQFILFDNVRNKVTRLGSLNPALASNATKVDRIEFKSAGRSLTGFVTTALAAPTTKLPLIVYPNPNPLTPQWVRYEPLVQLFASRGYAVFQANTRGTPGFGHSLYAAGHKKSGTVEIDDLKAGIGALGRSGRIDPKRVCVIGHEYSGRTALQLAARSDLIACVATNIPALSLMDWVAPLGSFRPRGYYADVVANFGDKAHLNATGPAALADQLDLPILYLHERFANDAHRSFMVAMRRAGSTQLVARESQGHVAATLAMLAFVENQIGPGTLGATKEANVP